MKKIIYFACVTLLLTFPFTAKATSTSKTSSHSGSSFCDQNQGEVLDTYHLLASNKDSAVADGSDSVSVTYSSTTVSTGTQNEAPSCGNANCKTTTWSTGFADSTMQIYSHDDGVKISQSGINYSLACSKTTTSATITSTSAGEKTIKVGYPAGSIIFGQPDPNDYVILSIKINFTTADGNTTSNTQTAKPKTTAKATPTPAKPTLTLATLNNVAVNAASPQIIQEGEPITFSGTASPNVTVRLFVYSDPIQVDTKSDQAGNWTYILTQVLAPGVHRVEAQTIDTSGNTSDKIELAQFTISPKALSVDEAEKSNDSLIYYIVFGGIGLILVGLLTYLIIKRKKHTQINQNF